MPLDVLIKSKNLKKIKFAEELLTLWGLDRLDRFRLEYLGMSDEDPCDDGDTSDEHMKQRTGLCLVKACALNKLWRE